MLAFLCLHIVRLVVLGNVYLVPGDGAWISDLYCPKKGKQKNVLINVK